MVPSAAIVPSFLSDFVICVTNGIFVEPFSVEFIFWVNAVISRFGVVVFTIVDNNVFVGVVIFPVEVVILLVVGVFVPVVRYSIVNGNIVVDRVVFLVDVAGFVDVNSSVVKESFVVDIVVAVSETYVVGSSSVDVECSVDNGGFVVIFSLDVISFVDINCSVGSSWSVDIISSVDDDCSVDFCNFVVDESISSVNVVISSVVVNFSVVIGKTVVDLVVLSADVSGTSLVISVVDISSVDEAVSANAIIVSVSVDDDDDEEVENVLFDIDVASSVVMNSKVVSGCIIVDSSVVVNCTVVSGTVFVVSVVHNE